MSLLSRGAWIEITPPKLDSDSVNVAPLTRSVDWNNILNKCIYPLLRSLLSRGAWIEIAGLRITIIIRTCRSSHEERGLKSQESFSKSFLFHVAPLTRSVDWNIIKVVRLKNQFSRSSHEERGLKLPVIILLTVFLRRSSHEERGLKFR